MFSSTLAPTPHYKKPVSRTKKMPLCSAEFEAGDEKRIEYESF